MGLFTHNKKKSDTIVGPSGYAYTADEDDHDHDRHDRRSSSTSATGAAAGAESTSSPRRSVESSRSHPRDEKVTPMTTQATPAKSNVATTTSRDEAPITTGTIPVAAAAPAAAVAASTVPLGHADEHREKIVETAHPPHSHPGREKDSVLSEADANAAEHDHKYLAPVTHERRHIHHIEEVERHRTVERHVHHIQHHIQPIRDEVHTEQVHAFREVPLTYIKENHAASAEDRALFERLNIGPSTTTIIPHDKVVVDKGETMRSEHIIHHVHHIVQPIWQRDLHEYFRLNPTNSAAPAPYTTSYTGPSALGSAYYPESSSATVVPNPASIATQHGHASSTSGSVPHSAVKPGHGLVPIEGSRHEINYVNREPSHVLPLGRSEIFPTRSHHDGSTVVPAAAGHPLTSTSAHGTALPTAAAGNTVGAEQGMRDLSLGSAH